MPFNHSEGAFDASSSDRGGPSEPFVTRRVAVAGIAGLLSGIGLGVGGRLLFESDSEEADRERLRAHYLRTRTIEDTETLRDLYVSYEWDALRRAGTSGIHSLEQERQGVRRFLDHVQGGFIRGLRENSKKEDGSKQGGTLHLLSMLKDSFEGNYPQDMVYNEGANSILYVPHGKVQCRSGTRLFVLSAMHILGGSLREGEQLVEVYSKGHVRPGVVISDGQIYALEMTERGGAVEYLGSLENPPQGLRVVRVEDALVQGALGLSRQELRPPLVDTVPKGVGGVTKQGGRGVQFDDTYAFGESDVPSGDRELPQVSPKEAAASKKRAAQIQYLMEHVAPKFSQTREYLSHLPRYLEDARRFRACLGDSLDRFENLSDQELADLVVDLSAIVIPQRRYEKEHDLNLVGLRMLCAAGVPEACYEVERVLDGRKGIGGRVVFDIQEEFARAGRLSKKRLEMDPLYGADDGMEDAFVNLRLRVMKERGEDLIDKIVAREKEQWGEER